MSVIYIRCYQKKSKNISSKRNYTMNKNTMSHEENNSRISDQVENIPDIPVERKKQIENIVADILKKSNIQKSAEESSLIVDIVRLVKGNDFAVESAEMDKDTTGLLIVNDNETVMDTNKNKLIVVNTQFDNRDNDENVVLKKSRFITAHEYGHYILHKKSGQSIYAHRDTAHRTEPEELEADYFARAILMPLHTFKIYVKVMKDFKLFDDEEMCLSILSDIFKSTKNKVAKRMKDLEELGA